MTEAAPVWSFPAAPEQALDVLGLGEISLDQVARLPHFPGWASKLAMTSWEEHPGGQMATALLTCARLGLRTRLLGSVGDDDAGRRALAPLREAGVALDGVRVRPGIRSRGAMILVDEASGERTVLWHRVAELVLSADEIAPEEIQRARLLMVDASDLERSVWAASEARALGLPVIIDVDSMDPDPSALLANATFPIVPESFADALGGVDAALADLTRRGALLPVVTQGERGAVGLWKGQRLEARARTVRVVDTTGAGDVFHGAFAWGLLAGYGPEQLLHVANAAAGMSCRANGAQGDIPSLSRLEGFLAAADRPIGGDGR
ncbi:MAG: ribokinase [Deltaproteobacteria bacterium]|nr:ribokinase [Deltaproteobacteria bacterium]MBW2396568.1 ribokinase [Deltaproteobacteria bacterium]